MKYKKPDNEKHLRVFENRSEYHRGDGTVEVFPEGIVSNDAKRRIKRIRDAFGRGFLDETITGLKNSKLSVDVSRISEKTQENLNNLVALVTSEVGRALIGLTVMQLSVKAIEPEQCIRLHKASASKGAFSWSEGVSMRTLDKNYVTPALRRHDLVRLNADGFMMTRSLAENYPYSDLYKAQLRGAREDWLSIVDELEAGNTDPLESLKYMVSLLLNSAHEFEVASNALIELVTVKIDQFNSMDSVKKVMRDHSEKSDYAARLLEISMHSLMQAVTESGAFGDVDLKPLSQMRSANKKHGNIGDIELLEHGEIIEAWDAKYGKAYLREEIEEVCEKIPAHEGVQVVGFVTSAEVERTQELERRLEEVAAMYGINIQIVTFDAWLNIVLKRCADSGMISEHDLAKSWMVAYAASLSQRKREVAPIDEPCMEWVRLLSEIIGRY